MVCQVVLELKGVGNLLVTSLCQLLNQLSLARAVPDFPLRGWR
jgi:hypothetical protein